MLLKKGVIFVSSGRRPNPRRGKIMGSFRVAIEKQMSHEALYKIAHRAEVNVAVLSRALHGDPMLPEDPRFIRVAVAIGYQGTRFQEGEKSNDLTITKNIGRY